MPCRFNHRVLDWRAGAVMRAHASFVGLGAIWLTGCLSVQLKEEHSVIDMPIDEEHRHEVSTEREPVTNLNLDGHVITGQTSTTSLCVDWTETRYDRVLVTTRTLMSPTNLQANVMVGAGGAGIGTGIALGVMGAANPPAMAWSNPQRTKTLNAAVVLAAVGGYFVANGLAAKRKSRDSSESGGVVKVRTDRKQFNCEAVPIDAGAKVVLADGAAVADVESDGLWRIDLAELDDAELSTANFDGATINSATDRFPATLHQADVLASVKEESELRQTIVAERVKAEQEAVRLAKEARQQALLAALPGRLRGYRGSWKLEQSTSPVDDSMTLVISRKARSSIQGWPGITHRPSLIFRCQEGVFDSFVTTGMSPEIERHDYSFDYATVTLRLDSDKAEGVLASKANSNDALFIGAWPGGVRALADHKSLYFQFTPFQSAPTETTFNLSGLADPLDILLTACGRSG